MKMREGDGNPMKIVLFSLLVLLLAGTSGCLFFLPEGEVPPNPAGESGLPREITRETAESSMAVALTQAAIRLGITPVDYYAMPGIRESFLRSLDPNLFRRTGPEQCRYLLVGSGRGDTWTLSIKRKNEIDFLWTKTITKIKGNRTLVEIDGTPAIKKYASWTGKKLKDLEADNLLVSTITAPLGVKDRLGDLIAIRHPMYGNEDGSMNIGANLAVNTAVIQMEASVDELINSTGKTMKELNKEMNGDVGAYLLVHCGGRRLGIGDRIDEVAKQLKKEAKGVPFITIFTFGEYGVKDHGANTTGGLMLSFTAFGK